MLTSNSADFPVRVYDGTKSILLSTRTIMGGRNPFLGIAYVVVGGICIVLGALFTATHLIKPRLVGNLTWLRSPDLAGQPQRRIQFADQWQNNDRKLGDHSYLSWNSDQPSSATTTGRAGRHGEGA